MTQDQIESFLTKQAKYTFAKTMASIPHSWICRKDYPDALFLNAMNFIEDKGVQEDFYGRTYNYLYIGDHKYWVCTDEDGFNDPSAIINQAKA